MFNYTYNANIRKVIVAFGSLFSKILIKHLDPETQKDVTIQVPIHYAPQEKFIQRLLQPSSITDGTRIEAQIPSLSFIMNSISPDSSRRLGRFGQNTNHATCGASGNQILNQIPVNLNFNLFAYTRHTEDMLQIVEQIMPYFVPDHIITLDFNSVQNDVQIPIIMTGNSLNERYEGDFSSRRVNIASFSFVAKAWIFGEIKAYSGITTTVLENLNFEL